MKNTVINEIMLKMQTKLSNSQLFAISARSQNQI